MPVSELGALTTEISRTTIVNYFRINAFHGQGSLRPKYTVPGLLRAHLHQHGYIDQSDLKSQIMSCSLTKHRALQISSVFTGMTEHDLLIPGQTTLPLDVRPQTTPANECLQPFFDRLSHSQSRWDENGACFSISTPQDASPVSSAQARQNLVVAIELFCFVYPRDRFFEVRFSEIHRTLTPMLLTAIEHSQEIPESSVADVVEALVCAASDGSLQERNRAIGLADVILNSARITPESYLWTAVAYQRSVIFRLKGDYSASSDIIDKFKRPPLESLNARAHSWQGRLHCSRISNLLQQDRYEEAFQQIDGWAMRFGSLMESRVSRSLTIHHGTVFHCKGRFEEALGCWTACYNVIRPEDADRYRIVSNIADLQCELGRVDEAQDILESHIKGFHDPDPKRKDYRRLLASKVLMHIARQDYNTAAQVLDPVLQFYDARSEKQILDVSDELLEIRSIIAHAQIQQMRSNFAKAVDAWRLALDRLRSYRSFRVPGPTYSTLMLSLATSLSAEGNLAAAASVVGEVHDEADYWIPRFKTSWVPYIRKQLEGLGTRHGSDSCRT